jgi:hypothetical protein
MHGAAIFTKMSHNGPKCVMMGARASGGGGSP